MASASSPCHRLLPPSSSPSLDPCSAVASASHPPDLPFSMTDDQPASPPSAADGSSPPVDDPRPSPPPAELSLRKTRFPRACTSRSHSVAAAARPPQPERRPVTRREKEEQQQTGRVITPLLEPPLPPQLPRWELRSMWELASIFNFLHIFRPLLNIAAEFSAEELETALLTASSTLDDVHMPLLKQEDIRNFIDSSLKHGIQLSAFRKERIGGDSHGISYWYEDDPIVGHRLYREIRRVETKNTRAKGSSSISLVSLQWETVATNLDEFQEVSDKLFSSKNRTEVSLGKKLKIDSLPEIERIHKKKEKLLKKQQREAILLDSFFTADGISSGRSLRDRKPVTYTFDDYDRSISEAIKITKRRQSSPDTIVKKPVTEKPEITANGKWNGSSQIEPTNDDDMESPKSNDYEETDDDLQDETLDRSNRRRKRPQRYSEKDFVDTVSDFDADMDSDDDIVGEAVYDEEYLRSRKQRKVSSGSEGDEEYRWEEENAEDEEEEEYSLSTSEDMDGEQCKKSFPSRTRQDKKLRSVELQTGLRRSKRAVRSRINYRQYELSDTDTGSGQPSKSNRTDANSNASGDLELSTASQDSHEVESEEIANNKITSDHIEAGDEEKQAIEKMYNNVQEENGVQRMRFLDLNELAPGTGLDDGPTTKDEDEHNF
ncbi:DDT domain-containing protein DDR4-like isoform X4 [Zingiber officinale]|uniref:DDT domain-containing protein DDR4-like isoform X4 n=1 Tax=Zingiber officinale TaxID=94328 RepID=UPI001C4D762A|nr:DDT domain-containing protein DDR4-like isoform X4 [Zingiber officinale]